MIASFVRLLVGTDSTQIWKRIRVSGQRDYDWQWADEFVRAHDGFVYWVEPEFQDHFNEIKNCLIKAREKALEKKFPALADELLEMMVADSQQFFEQVCHTNNGRNSYSLIPILASVDPERFVNAWLASPYSNWRWISYALNDRFESHRLQNELAPEKTWAVKVFNLLEAKAKNSDGFRKLRIRRTIPNSLFKLRESETSGA